MMERTLWIHDGQDKAYELYAGDLSFQDEVDEVYSEIDYKMRRPDILGKTVRVTEKQFPKVYQIIMEICSRLEMDPVPVYVYEDYYYGAESYGTREPWIEVSAKTIQDFTTGELTFTLARELYKVADGVTRQKTIAEERFKMIARYAPQEMEKISKVSFYKWFRLANYTADQVGYLMCQSVKESVAAILKMVLNSVTMAEQVHVKTFIEQASEINELQDTVSNYTKADEPVPYAPFRVQNLLAYAVSERGLTAVKGGK